MHWVLRATCVISGLMRRRLVMDSEGGYWVLSESGQKSLLEG